MSDIVGQRFYLHHFIIYTVTLVSFIYFDKRYHLSIFYIDETKKKKNAQAQSSTLLFLPSTYTPCPSIQVGKD